VIFDKSKTEQEFQNRLTKYKASANDAIINCLEGLWGNKPSFQKQKDHYDAVIALVHRLDDALIVDILANGFDNYAFDNTWTGKLVTRLSSQDLVNGERRGQNLIASMNIIT
jgi:hypothetical protein